jgi:hypothetical protein
MTPTFTSEQISALLTLTRQKASACFATASYYQAIPKKAHLFERWNEKAQRA